MGVITREVEVTINSANIKYFKDKGYNIPTIKNKYGKDINAGAKMMVSVSDLNYGSNCDVDVLCDMCKINIINTKFCNYISKIKKQGMYLCRDCGKIQRVNTSIKKYGVESYTQTQEYKERVIATNLERYGVPVSSQNQKVKDKAKETNLRKYGTTSTIANPTIKAKANKTIKERYGVDNISQSEEIKERKAQTNLKNTGYAYNLQNPKIQDKIFKSQLNIWGTEYPMQSPLFKEKMIEKYGNDNPNKVPSIKSRIQDTNIKKYGGISPSSSKDVQNKIRESMYQNGTVPTSAQQKAIYDLYKINYPQAELNLPICKSYSGDIVIDNYDIEIDYGGHNLSVKMGYETQEGFNQKQLIRDKLVKSEGYKLIRIIANTTRDIPSDEKLLELFSYARDFFEENPERSWIEFDIDNFIIRNAYYKDGKPYDYGQLRKLPRKSA